MFDDLAIASISTIAASGETEPFKYLLNHPSIGRAVVLGHYDGDEVNKIPVSGCGGLHGKNQQLKTSRTLFPEIEADDLDEFISQIEHTDVFLQTHLIAQKVAQLRKDPLPIIAAVVDHLTYQINPISLTLQENGSLHTVTNPELSIPPTKRKNRFPIIKINSLDENSAFVVRLPFSKKIIQIEVDDITGENIKISRKYLANAAAQIKYPLQEAIKHLQEGDFSDTKTLIIETPNIVISQQIAGYLASLKLVKEWIEKKGGPIIIGEVKSGHTTDNIYTHKALTY